MIWAMPLLDSWMPRFDVSASYSIDIDASQERVYASILDTDFTRSPIVAVLMGIRMIPALIASPRATWRRYQTTAHRTSGQLKTMLSNDFALLQEAPPAELVLGLTGRFWTPSGGLVPSDAATFRNPPPAGVARAAWNFLVEPIDDRRSRLHTETRVLCGDAATARNFKRYWRLVSPGSGVIRWVILRQVRKQATGAPLTR